MKVSSTSYDLLVSVPDASSLALLSAVATGIALLRIIDPRLKTKTMESFAIAYLPLLPVEVTTVSFAPFFALAGLSWITAGAWGLLALIVAALPFVFGWVPRASKKAETTAISTRK